MAGRKPRPEEIERFRAVLSHLRRVIAGDIGDLENDAFPTDAERASTDNPADNGSDSFNQEFSLELLARDEATLGEIVAALERCESGAFGRCESCEAWIPKARLEAMPYARNCIECQRQLEQAG